MFMQEIMCLMDKFASSSEGAMQEDQGAPFVCEYKMNLLLKVASNDGIFPRTKTRDRSSYDKTSYLNRGDNDV